jgi:hypothetical protein
LRCAFNPVSTALKVSLHGQGRNKPHIFRPTARAAAAVLEHHADPCADRRETRPKVVVEAGENPEHRTLAAAGWADEDAYLSGIERKADAGDHVVLFARRVPERLAGDIDLKPHGDATGIAGPQMAAPARFQ